MEFLKEAGGGSEIVIKTTFTGRHRTGGLEAFMGSLANLQSKALGEYL